MSLPLKKSWKIPLLILFGSGFLFGACTQGQGPGETPDKVTVAGGEGAPSADVCEKAENLDNILCQWVATEINAPSGGGSGGMFIELGYDSLGRISRLVLKNEKGNASAMGTLTYNEKGLWKINMFSEPNPPESTNYTREEERTTEYNADGSLKTVHVEKKDEHGAILSSSDVGPYQYFLNNSPPYILVLTLEKDGTGTVTNRENQKIYKEAGSDKTTWLDKQTWSPGTPVDVFKVWEITTLTYNQASGRMEKMEIKNQNCLAKNCGIASDPTAIDPTNVMVTEIKYDDQGRMAKFIQSSEGEVDQNNVIVSDVGYPPDPDGSMECQFKYELQSLARIAGPLHPFEFFTTMAGLAGFEVGFNDRDLFTSYSCNVTGQPGMNMTFKWVRLWEALPEGKPPGD